ncbi:hypothetical protein Leryth_019472 [Lithospermum erythrorhizon]|nr:hypothetical protein Leryth_019472 [Lithospermum erythrorhizon]
MGRLTAGVQYEPQRKLSTDYLGWKRDILFYARLDVVGGKDILNDVLKNPLEENEIVGLTNYIDFGLELQTRVDEGKATNSIQDSTFQVAASWQANKNFFAKAIRDRIKGETAFGFGLQVDNVRELSKS